MYPYQKPVVNRFATRSSLLLAFAPGTGKTPVAIACAEHLFSEGYVNLCLVVCPAALKFQWEERVAQFTDTKVTVIDGSKSERTAQYASLPDDTDQFVIISYDYVILDEELAKLLPGMVVLDEASAIKSFKTQRSKKIKKLFKDIPFRLALTATPIENRPEELYSIMQWVDSSVLGRYDLFEKAYITRHAKGWVKAYKNLDVLHEKLSDAMIRKARTDPDVAPYLPDVDEDNWTVPLDNKIARIYCDIADDMLEELAAIPGYKIDLRDPYSSDDNTPNGRLMAMHMCLEMVLCHPELVNWSANAYLSEKPEGSEYAYLLSKTENMSALPVPKLAVLKEELEYILDNPDSKVLIYSKYKEMLNILKRELPYDSVLFTGDMSSREKNIARKVFEMDPRVKLFLSSYAGGYGLDMGMADYLINYDLPWSFGTQDQINSRHIRASSVFDQVFIRNLVVHGSIEERKLRVLDRKRTMSLIAVDGVHKLDNSLDTSVNLDADFLKDHLTQFMRKYEKQ